MSRQSVRPARALAGCTGVFIGFESLHNDNLADSKKKSPRTEDYARRVAVLHRHGIQVNGSFVFGMDDDDGDVFRQTVDWAIDRGSPPQHFIFRHRTRGRNFMHAWFEKGAW